MAGDPVRGSAEVEMIHITEEENDAAAATTAAAAALERSVTGGSSSSGPPPARSSGAAAAGDGRGGRDEQHRPKRRLTMEQMRMTPTLTHAPSTANIQVRVRRRQLVQKSFQDMSKVGVKSAREVVNVVRRRPVRPEVRVPVDDVYNTVFAGLFRRKQRNTMMRSLVFYAIFVIITVSVAALQMQVFHRFLFSQSADDAIITEEIPGFWFAKSFNEISVEEDMWMYLNGPFLDRLTASSVDDSLHNVVFNYDKVMGGLRFRTKRVTNDSCDITSTYTPLFSSCYSSYRESNQAKEPFGPPSDPTMYRYLDADDTESVFIWGHFGNYYGGGGYVVDTPVADLNTTIARLRTTDWINMGTRLMVVTVYLTNINVNLVLEVRLMFEYLPTGGVKTWSDYKYFQLLLYRDGLDRFRAVLEVIWVVMLLGYVVSECVNVYRAVQDKKKEREDEADPRSPLKYESCGQYTLAGLRGYYSDMWNVVDLFSLVLFIIFLVYWLIYILDPQRTDVVVESSAFLNLERLAWKASLAHQVLACNMFFLFLKLFKYFQFNKRTTLLWASLGHAAGNLLVFGIFFLIVLLGFTCSGFMIFGYRLRAYRDFTSSFSSTLRMSLGDFDYETMRDANRILAPIYVAMYLVLVFYTLVNIFLAIIMDAYAFVHAKHSADDNPLHGMAEFMHDVFHAFVHYLKRCFACCSHRGCAPMPLPSHAYIVDTIDDVSKRESHITLFTEDCRSPAAISAALVRQFSKPDGYNEEDPALTTARKWTQEERRHVETEIHFLFVQAFSEYDAETESREADLRRRHIQKDISHIHDLVKGLDKKIV